MSEPLEEHRFWAFISYSHRDERSAAWLHRQIEQYRVPVSRLIRQDAERKFPQRLAPVFRDRTDLAAATHLPQKIREALGQSRFLIVVCSPAAAASEWVAQEIIEFQRLGRQGQILAYIVDGEPPAVFPAPLLRLSESESLPATPVLEPLAADARPGHDGKDAYLKLIAGMLGVSFDSLKQRDTELRNQRLRRLLGVSLAVTLLTIGIALWGWYERGRADTNAKNAMIQLAEVHWSQAIIDRDEREDHIAAGWNFFRAAEALSKAASPDREANARLACKSEFMKLDSHRQLNFDDTHTGESLALLCTDDNRVRLWDLQQERQVREFPHEHVSSARFNAAGTRLLSYGSRGSLRLWDVTRSEPLREWKHGVHSLTGAEFTNNDSQFYSWSKDGTLRLWDVNSPEHLRNWQSGVTIRTGRLSQDHKLFLCWNSFSPWREATIIDLTEDQEILNWIGIAQHPAQLYSSDGTQILSRTADGTAKLWDVVHRTLRRTWRMNDTVSGVVFANDPTRILTWTGKTTFRMWDVLWETPLQTWNCDLDVSGARFSGDGSQVLTWGKNALDEGGCVRLWDANTRSPIHVWRHDEQVRGAVFSDTESHVISWGDDRSIRLREIRPAITSNGVDERLGIQTWRHRRYLSGAWFSADGQYVIADTSSTLHRWRTMKAQQTLQNWQHDQSVRGVLIGHDSEQVFSWTWGDLGQAGTICAWNVNQSQPVRRWTSSPVIGAALMPKPGRILAWHHDGGIRLWDTADDQPVATFTADSPIIGGTTNAAMTRLLTWNRDHALTLWDLTRRQMLQTWPHGQGVLGANFSPSQRTILSWSSDRKLSLWQEEAAEAVHSWTLPHPASGAIFTNREQSVLAWDDGQDGTLHLCHLSDREPHVFAKTGHPNQVVLCNTDESRVLSWGSGGGGDSPSLWDLRAAQRINTKASGRRFYSLHASPSPDRKQLLTWNQDGVEFWGFQGRQSSMQFDDTRKHLMHVEHAELNREGTRFLTWTGGTLGVHGQVYVWDVAHSLPIMTWQFELGIIGASFTPDGKRVVTWGADNVVRVLDCFDDPEVSYRELQLRYEAETGTTPGANSRYDDLDFEDWSARLRDYRQMRPSPIAVD